MVEVSCPDGWRVWVAHSKLECGRVADKAARLFGYAEGVGYRLSDRENRLLSRGDPVIDGESYLLIGIATPRSAGNGRAVVADSPSRVDATLTSPGA